MPSTPRPSFGLVVKDDCLADRPSWFKVGCDDGRAVAKVVGLGIVTNPLNTGSAQADCPADTDSVLKSPEGGSAYYCLRNLRPPHQARPGLGGGIIVVGDCLVKRSANYVEVPCKGGLKPEYKVTEIAEGMKRVCDDDEGVRLSADRLGLKSYCARRL
ncbi:hypothetical protein [Actinomadura roseirufa]|uniref:hypothetical protein n=1 Tax=Actinomadura roseirufa TaxID=2094049 RepID=UPI00104198DB|nr:hypothetical protein [Actinomadura roseirufa]